jgi:hypothetical protein
MAGREVYPEEAPRKRSKKENKDDIGVAINDSILDSVGLTLADQQVKVFEVKSGIRKGGDDANKVTLLEKSALRIIDKICDEKDLEKKGAIMEIMESAMKEFYSKIIDQLNGLQVTKPDKVKITSNPKAVIKEKISVIHNQRKASELAGAIKDIDIIKVLKTPGVYRLVDSNSRINNYR